MQRIPYPDPTDLSEEKQSLLADPNFVSINLTRMMMHAPDEFWRPQRALGRAAVWHATITDQEREIVILRVAYLSSSDYELHHHLALARTAGLTDAQIDAMRTGDLSCLTARERCLAEFVSQVVLLVAPDDACVSAMRAAFGDVQLFEVLAIIGYYMAMARIAAVSGIPLDGDAIASWTR
jgi:4-carboxymuconolactone decarboxylase